ncbi:ubiquitin-like domain-containing protein [Cellulosimicrobium marinum]|uniref:aggregation-promoting factor C-terminal-like domain-containing protein n=1 Tax=Cellulosimicrobium marinum TaxID=1638992 RepID=UPI001E3A8F54|nr:ubiquitin-like domain-containing protein [Cellulosimicrobium marinum]MCB7137003.1 ubiquitin-like domain-containing protein [Cellulosimicrobium marinum]
MRVLAPDGTTRRRVQRLVAQGVVVVGLVGVTGAFATLHKSVTLDVDGELYDVSAYGRTVAEVLDYQDVAVAPDDLVEPALDRSARDGGTIVVRTSQDVTVEIDGRLQTISTTARTVGELLTYLGPRAENAVTNVSRSAALGREPVRVSTLKTVHVAVDGAVLPITTAEATVRGVLVAAGIVLGEDDDTSVPLDAAAVDGMLVMVSRAASSSATVTEVLPFATEEVEDPNLPEGHRVVVQSGRVGEAVTTYAVQSLGGAEVSRTVLTRSVTTEPRDEIIKVGTMDVSVSVDPGSARAIGRSLAAQRGWGDDQFVCLDKLWTKESNWRVDADNPSSSAYGIPQALPGSKMASAGADWMTNPATQITWGLGYIEGRYGTPCSAWSHSVSVGWY